MLMDRLADNLSCLPECLEPGGKENTAKLATSEDRRKEREKRDDTAAELNVSTDSG